VSRPRRGPELLRAALILGNELQARVTTTKGTELRELCGKASQLRTRYGLLFAGDMLYGVFVHNTLPSATDDRRRHSRSQNFQ